MVETSLPRGVALVRVQVGGRKVVLVSPLLSPRQELVARVTACVLAANGSPYVLVGMTDLLAVVNDTAA